MAHGPEDEPALGSSGVSLIILLLALGDFVAQIPMGALVAVMVMVSISTFDWHSVAPTAVTDRSSLAFRG